MAEVYLVASESPIVALVVKTEYPLAPAYERVHFVGTALFDIGITEKNLKAHADEMVRALEDEVGYRVFLVDIKVTNRILWTDVDFIFDVPYIPESLILGMTVAAFLGYLIKILALIVALAFIVWLFWTIWIEKVKIYYCEQCPDYPSFQGYAQFRAHYAAFHPEKYEAASEEPWWEELAEALPLIVKAVIVVTVVSLVTVIIAGGKKT